MDAFNDQLHNWVSAWGWTGEAAFRLLLAALLGGIIGLEREVRGREAGFRTHLLVCLGSALVMIVSNYLVTVPWPHHAGQSVNVDPGRIAYGVMTGIGFLGAGTILKHTLSVRGLTTAAALWCVAALGLAIGIGLYVLAAVALALILAALLILNYIEKIILTRRFRRIIIRAAWADGCIPAVLDRVRQCGLDVHDVGFRRLENLAQADIELQVSYLKIDHYRRFESQFSSDPQSTLILSERA